MTHGSSNSVEQRLGHPVPTGCAFFAFEVTTTGDEVVWDAQVIDNPTARAVLDEFYALTENATSGVDDLRTRFTEKGLTFVNQP